MEITHSAALFHGWLTRESDSPINYQAAIKTLGQIQLNTHLLTLESGHGNPVRPHSFVYEVEQIKPQLGTNLGALQQVSHACNGCPQPKPATPCQTQIRKERSTVVNIIHW